MRGVCSNYLYLGRKYERDIFIVISELSNRSIFNKVKLPNSGNIHIIVLFF